ncbi:ribosome biogenesis GTPase Der [Vulgatibacter incomptus]|uniref:GTPase Der n=1 Tax=Vulgatibacter incomptus TaxID=1391653 RepID=A0A0K1PBQ3_9BACT|nr:ribosome biogenesis GTPase Der [Vulgatibacter incomptus]AKU90955.1 GTP-binding protein EngA [Vulgatibacter incomptus]
MPVVAIVGRPNVGKSTLFNRIIGKRVAIVEDLPGVTRDRNYFEAEHGGRRFLLVDTGGFEPDTPDRLIQQVRDQAQLAIDEAQAVLLVVDGHEGPTGVDVDIASMVRRSGKPLFLAVNKIDSFKREEEGFLSEFHRFGIDRILPVSAEHGRGTEDLLDAVMTALPPAPEPEPVPEALDEEATEEVVEDLAARPIRLAIIGRPNVGKSTLVNQLIGEERFVTSPIAGTTRDPVDAELEHKGRHFILTDTAGIRRKRSIAMRVEAYSVVRALKAAEASDVVVMLLDATEMAVEQDLKIASLAVEQGKPVIVVVNKWDLVAGDAKKAQTFRDDLVWKMPFLAFAPSIFVSALTGAHVKGVLDRAVRLFDQASSRVPTPKLNRLLEDISNHHGLPVVGGQRARVYYIAQVGIRPPTFVVQTNRPDLVPPEYRRYVANKLREVFELEVPLRLVFKRKASLRPPPKRVKEKAAGRTRPRR